MKKLLIATLLFFSLFTSLYSSLAFAQSPTTTAPWAHESEVGIVTVSGNTDSESYNAKQTTTYRWDQNLLSVNGRYLEAKTGSATTAKSWNVGLRYERSLSELWSLFASHKAESDRFAGFIQRDISDLGAKYFIKKTDDLIWFAEFGYSYVNTYSLARVHSYDPSTRAYTEASKKLEKNLSVKYWIEYIQSLEKNAVYYVNTELSLNVMLNDVLSLKTGYLLKYVNVPVAPAVEYSDKTFTTALVAKF